MQLRINCKSVLNYLKKGLSGYVPETPKANNPVFEKTSNILIGSNIEALMAAEKEAIRRGYTTQVLSSMIEGVTSEVARMHSAIAKEIMKTGHPVKPPACILSGGETTVTLKGDGWNAIKNLPCALLPISPAHGLLFCSPAAPMETTGRRMPPAPSLTTRPSRVQRLQN